MSPLLAGFCIGLGCIANLINGGVVGAVLFTFGLITVVHYKYKLYTGTAGFVQSKDDILQLGLILIFNILGCFLLSTLAWYAIPADKLSSVFAIISNRVSMDSLSAFLLSMLCGFIMTTAVQFAREGKFLPLLFGVPIFILSGYLHSIADAFYISLALLYGYPITVTLLVYYLMIVLGNFVGCNLYRAAN